MHLYSHVIVWILLIRNVLSQQCPSNQLTCAGQCWPGYSACCYNVYACPLGTSCTGTSCSGTCSNGTPVCGNRCYDPGLVCCAVLGGSWSCPSGNTCGSSTCIAPTSSTSSTTLTTSTAMAVNNIYTPNSSVRPTLFMTLVIVAIVFLHII
jgi:hypothetical protein